MLHGRVTDLEGDPRNRFSDFGGGEGPAGPVQRNSLHVAWTDDGTLGSLPKMHVSFLGEESTGRTRPVVYGNKARPELYYC